LLKPGKARVNVYVEEGEKLRKVGETSLEELPAPLQEVLITNVLAIAEAAEDGEVAAAVLDAAASDFRVLNLGKLGLPRKLSKLLENTVAWLVLNRDELLA